MTDFNPTEEQEIIVKAIRDEDGNIIIVAYAGTGKTSTLALVQGASKRQPVLCLAFNKNIAVEMEKRFPTTTTVRTFNSLGHRIMMKWIGSLSFDTKKIPNLLQQEIKDLKGGPDRDEAWDLYTDLREAIDLARSLGYVPAKFKPVQGLISAEDFYERLNFIPTSLAKAIIDNVLFTSIKTAYKGSIDYNDQIYMPALFGGTFPRFPLVMVDEDQDMSPTNHAMLYKLLNSTSRLCAVGDRWQSIYGFRGADTQSVDRLKQKFSCKELGLSVSFRCPQAIVEAARWRVPDFKWIKAGGRHEVLKTLHPADIPEEAAIICRNNAPLFRCALGLLSSKRSVSVAGSEIGPRILRIMGKLGDADVDRDGTFELIAEWRHDKLSKAQKGGQQIITDMAACMEVFATYGTTLGQAIAYAEHLFAQQGSIKLLTGHKAKGLEFDTVYHLDPGLIRDSQDDQEKNLRYVITTRSKQELYEINSEAIAWTNPSMNA